MWGSFADHLTIVRGSLGYHVGIIEVAFVDHWDIIFGHWGIISELLGDQLGSSGSDLGIIGSSSGNH